MSIIQSRSEKVITEEEKRKKLYGGRNKVDIELKNTTIANEEDKSDYLTNVDDIDEGV